MTKELEERLTKRFGFYRDNLPIAESLMCFGFECNDGWFDLIWELSEQLEKLLQEYKDSIPVEERAKDLLLDLDIDFNVVQVKEKYGGLRFYTNWATEKMQCVIDAYEKKSYTICESCGSEARHREIGRWYSTLCENCYSKRQMA